MIIIILFNTCTLSNVMHAIHLWMCVLISYSFQTCFWFWGTCCDCYCYGNYHVFSNFLYFHRTCLWTCVAKFCVYSSIILFRKFLFSYYGYFGWLPGFILNYTTRKWRCNKWVQCPVFDNKNRKRYFYISCKVYVCVKITQKIALTRK